MSLMQELRLGVYGLVGLIGLGGSALLFYDIAYSHKGKEEKLAFSNGNFDSTIHFQCFGRENLDLFFDPCKQEKNITQVSIEPHFTGFSPKEEISPSLQTKMDCMGYDCFSMDPEIEHRILELYKK